jgi:L-aminopeptidase/D-esterase-like protein
VVATNARLRKVDATKVAQMAQDGLARAIDPAHTSRDGDTIFAAATGVVEAPLDLVGVLAASVVADAIVRGVRAAAGAHES